MIARLRPPIAIVDMQGQIGPAMRPLEYARLLARLREDRSVRAVVLNIDSPGGLATGADLITRAVLRLRDEKPVASFIGGIGASGGYMIAAATQRIIALPSAIVGAIGVISYRPVVYEALQRIGVGMRVAKSGRLKDMLSPFREATDEEREKEQYLLDSLYDLFVDGIVRGRNLPEERVRELATGEVFPASDAVEHGLVDALGDLDDAVDWVAEQSGAPRRLRIVRPRRTLRELLFGRGLSSTLAGALMAELESVAHAGGYYLYSGPSGGR